MAGDAYGATALHFIQQLRPFCFGVGGKIVSKTLINRYLSIKAQS
jgi:hypothetical protein